MHWRQTRLTLLVAVVLAATAVPARPQEEHHPAPAQCAAPAFHTVWVREWVPETYERVRTVYRPEKRVETYTAYRCESADATGTHTVPYQATRVVCVWLPHEETVGCTRRVCRLVQKQLPCEPGGRRADLTRLPW